MITIVDGQAAKSIMLMPSMKLAVAMDMKKSREEMKKSAKGAPPDLFEMVRRLVREGSSGTGDKAERLGKKEIDGRQAVGFRVHANGMDMTLWADPETARPIRIEITMEMLAGVHYGDEQFPLRRRFGPVVVQSGTARRLFDPSHEHDDARGGRPPQHIAHDCRAQQGPVSGKARDEQGGYGAADGGG